MGSRSRLTKASARCVCHAVRCGAQASQRAATALATAAAAFGARLGFANAPLLVASLCCYCYCSGAAGLRAVKREMLLARCGSSFS